MINIKRLKKGFNGNSAIKKAFFLFDIISLIILSLNFHIKVFADAVSVTNPTNLTNLGDIFRAVLPFAFAIIGLTFFIMIIYGGFSWITAGDSPEKVKKSQGILIAAVIGFIIIALSGVILTIVNNLLSVKNPITTGFITPAYAAACNQGDANCQLGFPKGSLSTNGATTPSNTDPNAIIAGFISTALGIAFFVALVFVILGGIKYITSSGDPQKAEAARKQIMNALIGIVIVSLAWSIIQLVSHIFNINPVNIIPTGSNSTGPIPS